MKLTELQVRVSIIGIVIAMVALIIIPTIVEPAIGRINAAIEERRLNAAFRRLGIDGSASFQSRLFDGAMSICVSNIDDAKLPGLAQILGDQQRVMIDESIVSWEGLRYLSGCKSLRYIIFVNTNVSDADLQRLQDAMPGSRVTGKWQNGRPFFEGKK